MKAYITPSYIKTIKKTEKAHEKYNVNKKLTIYARILRQKYF